MPRLFPGIPNSIGMEDVYKAVAVKLKDVKLTEREHKILVVTEWHEFKKDREAFDEALRHIAALKGTNKTEIGKYEERLNVMKYADKKAPQKDIAIEERKLERLEEERVSLLEREKKVGDDGMQRYNDLDAFLELAKNGSRYWTKALDDKKRILADMIVSNVMVDGDKVASVTLTPQFEEWAKRGKNLDGRDERILRRKAPQDKLECQRRSLFSRLQLFTSISLGRAVCLS